MPLMTAGQQGRSSSMKSVREPLLGFSDRFAQKANPMASGTVPVLFLLSDSVI